MFVDNPAQELLEDLDAITAADGPFNDRMDKLAKDNGLNVFEYVEHLLRLTREVEHFCNTELAAEAGRYKNLIQDLVTFLHQPNGYWKRETEYLSQVESLLPFLSVISALMRERTIPVPQISDSELQSLKNSLEEIRTTLRSVTKDDSGTVHQLIRLCDEALDLISDSGTVNDANRLRTLSFEIIGALAIFIQSEPEEIKDSTRFKQAAKTVLVVVGTWLGTATAGGVGAIGAEAASKLIGM